MKKEDVLKISLIEKITIFEGGSSCVEFNRCYYDEELDYIRNEMSKADKLHKYGEKLVYIPGRNRK